MREYSVTEIAKKLGVNEETVRRWIRSGELKANMMSKKQGNVVNEYSLYEFVKMRPKYKDKFDIIDTQINSTYEKTLTELLTDLMKERELLNERIYKIQTLLGEV